MATRGAFDSTKERSVEVAHDDDGGVTVKDIRSGLVISIIGTHPAASGPAGVYIEVYPYETDKDVNWNAGKTPEVQHHATFACYPVPRLAHRQIPAGGGET